MRKVFTVLACLGFGCASGFSSEPDGGGTRRDSSVRDSGGGGADAGADSSVGRDEGMACVDDSYPDECGSAPVMQINEGDSMMFEGKLPTLAGGDWFLFEFPPMSGPDTRGGGMPSVVLEGDATMVLDLRESCEATGAVTCGEGSAREATSWSFLDDQSEMDGEPGADYYRVRNIPWPGTLAVRVQRSGGPANCEDYRLTVSR